MAVLQIIKRPFETDEHINVVDFNVKEMDKIIFLGTTREDMAELFFKSFIFTTDYSFIHIHYIDLTDDEIAEVPDYIDDYVAERFTGSFKFTYKINNK